MSLIYKILYGVGFTPWEEMAELPIAEQISAMFDREEEGRQPPYGPALDLGCGSGIWAVNLARRGWEVTGVDVVPKAIRAAKKRAQEAAVEVRFIEGDVTKLRAAGIGSGYRLVIDFACIHGLGAAQREAAGEEVSAVASADATVLIGAWAPGRRAPMLPRGASREDIEAAFHGWSVVDDVAFDASGAPGSVTKAEPRWYTLRRA